MKVELKVVTLTKSKILQMCFVPVNSALAYEVLGWVNIEEKRYVLVKYDQMYFRTEFILNIDSDTKTVQFPLPGGGYEFRALTKVKFRLFNSKNIFTHVERDESENQKFYHNLQSFKRKTDAAGQIYY